MQKNTTHKDPIWDDQAELAAADLAADLKPDLELTDDEALELDQRMAHARAQEERNEEEWAEVRRQHREEIKARRLLNKQTKVNWNRVARTRFSLTGLQADFPTSTELEKFVYDETGVSLRLKGLDPEYKYQLALDVLQGKPVVDEFVTDLNPYVDNNELIPEDPIKPIPARDPRLPQNAKVLCVYHDMTIPHPDKNLRALDAKVICQFKTYENGAISYEILGPLEKQAEGEKLDKYGRARPAKFIYVDPRTGEQGLRYSDGSYSRMGQRLRTLLETKRVNRNQSVWSTWIDRDFTLFNQDRIENPWDDQ